MGAYWTVTDNLVMMRPAQALLENHKRTEWLKFIDYVKDHRKGSAFNKLIISVSITAFSEDALENLTTKLTAIKNRIAQIFVESGYSIPISIIFTGLETLPGYTEFTQALSMEQRQQVLGLYSTAKETDFNSTAFPRILNSLNDFLDRQFQHGEYKNVEMIYSFSNAFQSAQTNWLRLSDLLFGTKVASSAHLSGFFCLGKMRRIILILPTI